MIADPTRPTISFMKLRSGSGSKRRVHTSTLCRMSTAVSHAYYLPDVIRDVIRDVFVCFVFRRRRRRTPSSSNDSPWPLTNQATRPSPWIGTVYSLPSSVSILTRWRCDGEGVTVAVKRSLVRLPAVLLSYTTLDKSFTHTQYRMTVKSTPAATTVDISALLIATFGRKFCATI